MASYTLNILSTETTTVALGEEVTINYSSFTPPPDQTSLSCSLIVNNTTIKNVTLSMNGGSFTHIFTSTGTANLHLHAVVSPNTYNTNTLTFTVGSASYSLNASLVTLGTTMASNLTTMGVTSSASEGLTTLTGKILDISGGGATVNNLTLTTNKTILSYYHSDTATLTATATDTNNNPIENAKILILNGTTILDTITTDNNGEATYTYTSTAIGDMNVYAVAFNAITQTITIEDCYYYDTTERTITNSSTTVYNALATGVEAIINQNWILNFDLNNLSGNGAMLCVGAKSQYTPPTSANYRLTIGRDGTVLSMNNRTSSSSFSDSGDVSDNTWYNVQMKKETVSGTTTIYATSDNTSWRTNYLTPITWLGAYSEYDLYVLGWSNANCKLKNIKLKVV